METLIILSLSMASLLASIFLTIFFTSRNQSGNRENHKLPPGNMGWPIIGETIYFILEKPQKFVQKRRRKYSQDIFKTNIIGEKTIILCGAEAHKFLFSNDQRVFIPFIPYSILKLMKSDKIISGSPPTAVSMSEQAKYLRRQSGFLKPGVLVRYVGEMDSITLRLLQSHWEGERKAKAFPFIKTLTLTLASRFFLGTEKPERIARLVKLFDDVKVGMHSIPLNIPGTRFWRALKATAAIREELKELIREKISGEPTQDILSHFTFMTDSDGEKMSEREIADGMMGFLVAGYSTIAAAIAFFMKYVGERPEIYDQIRAEQMGVAGCKKPGEVLKWEDMQKMKYSWNVVCETLRLAPPILGGFREVLEDITYDGYTIPKGWKVFWTVSTTHKNEAYFQDPETFDPSRFERGEGSAQYVYLPFGCGPRMCPGKEYSRVAILAIIHNLVKLYRWEMLIPDEKMVGDMMPIPEKGLPIRLHPHY